MRGFIAALLLCATTSASAIITVSIDAYCVDKKTISGMLVEYDEKPLLTGISVRDLNNQDVPIAMVIYASRKAENSFTILEKVNDDLYCIISVGNNLKPYNN